MSATPRIFIDTPLVPGQSVELDEAQSHYISRVMRLNLNDNVRVFNGQDGEFLAKITAVSKRAVALTPETCTRAQTSGPDLWLAFAPLKKAKTDLVIEKAVELGVKKIVPVQTERCQAQAIRLERFERIVIEASEQTERLDIPEIGAPASLDDFVADWESNRLLMFCDESGDDSALPWGGESGRARAIAEELSNCTEKAACVLIGPEGGFTPAERKLLRSLAFVLPVSLGPRILRAETAAITALAVWQAILGDWTERSR